jgi:hypothetical protein
MKTLGEAIRAKQKDYLERMNEALAQAIIKARLEDYEDEFEFEVCEKVCSKCRASRPIGSQVVTSATIEPPLATEPERIGCLWDVTKISGKAVIYWARLECKRFGEFFWRVDEQNMIDLLEQ